MPVHCKELLAVGVVAVERQATVGGGKGKDRAEELEGMMRDADTVLEEHVAAGKFAAGRGQMQETVDSKKAGRTEELVGMERDADTRLAKAAGTEKTVADVEWFEQTTERPAPGTD